VLSFVLCCPLRFPFKNSDVRFVSLAVVCRRARILFTFLFCLRIVVSTTYCVVFYFGFSPFVYPMLPVSLDCRFLITSTPSVFSNVYIHHSVHRNVHRNAQRKVYNNIHRNVHYHGQCNVNRSIPVPCDVAYTVTYIVM
jgi:hypothetical protein